MAILLDNRQLISIGNHLKNLNSIFEESVSGSTIMEFPQSFEIKDENDIYLGSVLFEDGEFLFAPDYIKEFPDAQ